MDIPNKTYNLSKEIERLSQRVRKILKDAGEIADKGGYNAYVVGGFVRDLILGVENFDMDIVVEGNAIVFAEQFSKKYSVKHIVHERFQTAVVELEDNFNIDMVSARKEYYEYPGALPNVEKGSIRDDLYRRDFTINCMAIKLNNLNYGEVTDLFEGLTDLKNGVIRVLHDESFIEDPTRIFRAIRFEQRYGFRMDEKTEKLALSAIDSGAVQSVSNERVSFEFFALLNEKNVSGILERMLKLGLLNNTYPEIILTDDIKRLIDGVDKKFDSFQKNLKFKENIDRILLYIILLHSNMDLARVCVSADRMRLTKDYREEIIRFVNIRDKGIGKPLTCKELSDYEFYYILEGFSIEAIFALYMENEDEIFERMVFRYLNHSKRIKIFTTGKDLMEMGIKPGPEYKEILDSILKEKVNGNIDTLDDELLYIKRIRG
jgi:tRNA nucleotidyltransferase (CCA-adding enzyme)